MRRCRRKPFAGLELVVIHRHFALCTGVGKLRDSRTGGDKSVDGSLRIGLVHRGFQQTWGFVGNAWTSQNDRFWGSRQVRQSVCRHPVDKFCAGGG